MSVLIKGMDMPTNCADCKARIAIGCCGNLPHNMRMPNCPLVEVPKHGRLVDEKEILRPFKDFEYGEDRLKYWRTDYEGFKYILSQSPTVIESEE